MKIKYAFGIDLGTTNSCIAVSTKNMPAKIIRLRNPDNTLAATLPSCVMYTPEGTIVGRPAYDRRYETAHVVYSSKRDIGSNKVYTLTVNDKPLAVTPVDVAAEILSTLKHSAEVEYGEVKDVTITVPAYFEADARHATLEAAKKAGLNVLALINEPTAAALNYASTTKQSERVLVYDLGGGTFDVTILDISIAETNSDIDDIFGESESSGVFTKVLSTGGNRCLGGDDLDRIVADKALEYSEPYFKQQHPEFTESLADLVHTKYPIVYEQIVLTAERLKKRLDTSDVHINDMSFGGNDYCPFEFRVTFVEELFEQAAEIIFSRTVDILDQCFKRAQVPYASIDKIILIGGSTKLSYIREDLKEFLAEHGLPKSRVYSNINPDEAVALGASINSAIYFGDSEMVVSDVLSQSIGIAEQIDVDGKITGEQYTKLILRNSAIPQTKIYTTNIQPNQTEARIPIYQGDSALLAGNMHIGTVHLAVPCVDKQQDIEITLVVDASGALNVTAKAAGNSISAKLENVLRPAARATTKETKVLSLLSRFENSLLLYASDEDKEVGLDMIDEFKGGNSNISIADIRSFVTSATRANSSKSMRKSQQKVRDAVSLTGIFSADGANTEESSND